MVPEVLRSVCCSVRLAERCVGSVRKVCYSRGGLYTSTSSNCAFLPSTTNHKSELCCRKHQYVLVHLSAGFRGAKRPEDLLR